MKIQLKDWPRYMAQLGGRFKPAVQRGLMSGAMRCVPLMQKRTENAVPASDHGSVGAFNTGEYRGNWRVSAIENGARIYNPTKQAGIIDGGRRPGALPPLDAIEKWARRRLGLGEKEAKVAAYPIAKAIAARGLRPRNVMSGATDEMKRIVEEECRRELNAEMAKP